MAKTLTVKELIEVLEGEDQDALVVFASNYGDRSRTQQVHFINGQVESDRIRSSGYSDSGYALGGEQNEDGPEVLVIS